MRCPACIEPPITTTTTTTTSIPEPSRPYHSEAQLNTPSLAAVLQLRLPLRCDVRQGELHLLLLLVSRGFGVQQLWIGETAPTNALSQRLIGGGMEPCWMTSREFWQQV